eukprot:jgi/Mesvir1/1564/Mv25078-RA.3
MPDHGNLAEGPAGQSKRQEFPAFPFTPYPIQQQLMQKIYDTIDSGGVGIFESPTGTGKTLSVICSALQWLEDQKTPPVKSGDATATSQLDSRGGNANGDNEPAWVLEYEVDRERKHKEHVRTLRQKNRELARREVETFKARANARGGRGVAASGAASLFGPAGTDPGAPSASAARRASLEGAGSTLGKDEDSELLLGEWDDTQAARAPLKRLAHADGAVSSDSDGYDSGTDLGTDATAVKIFFSSRTHSQLSQFVNEVNRTPFRDADVQMVALASRKALCINEAVTRLGNVTRMNERCLDLQKASKDKRKKTPEASKGATTSKGCRFRKKSDASLVKYASCILSAPMDIEDLVSMGKERECCPYYASRRALPAADLITLPYTSLLHQATRESLGVSLRGNVVIIDEAHNLVDAINALHSCQVSGAQVSAALRCVQGYLSRFQSMLGDGNLRHLRTLVLVLQATLRVLRGVVEAGADSQGSLQAVATPTLPPETQEQQQQQPHQQQQQQRQRLQRSKGSLPVNGDKDTGDGGGGGGTVSRMVTVNGFLLGAGIDHVNLFKLQAYLRGNNVLAKLSSYAEQQEAQPEDTPEDGNKLEGSKPPPHWSTLGCLHGVASFLAALTNADKDGRMLLTITGALATSSVKFVMLNAAAQFQQVVDEARAVILIGGTLQPVGDMVSQLFPHVPAGRVNLFSCRHIVPKGNLLAMAVACGPTGKRLELAFQNRALPDVMDELGRLLLNVCRVVPDGVVCFVASYAYEDALVAAWKRTGTWDAIEAKKKIFREPRGAADVDAILSAYQDAIQSTQQDAENPGATGKGGALLMSVVGGKMSEGINFSDGLGRCVVMMGLPYANPGDPELCARMEYLDRIASSQPDASQAPSSQAVAERDPIGPGGAGSSGSISCAPDQGGAAFLTGPSNGVNGRGVASRALVNAGRSGEPGKGMCSGREYYENLCMRAVNQSIGMCPFASCDVRL